MKRVIVVFFSLFLFLFSAGAEAKDLDSLIVRVGRKMASCQRNFDYTCLVSAKEYKMDKHWKPKATKSIEKRLIKNGDEAYFDVIKAMEIKKDEEKDITEEVRKEYNSAREKAKEEAEMENEDKDNGEEEGGRRGISMTMEDLDPFGEARRELYNFLALPDTISEGQRYFRVKTMAIEPSDKVFEGEYWINPETHAIVIADLHPSKNPKMVSELKMRFRFEEIGEGRWMPRKIWTHIYVNLLIKKIRVETEEVYSDYHFEDT